jgi:hypothetical protein
MKDDDKKKPPIATVSRIPRRVSRDMQGPQGDFGHGYPPPPPPYGPFGPIGYPPSPPYGPFGPIDPEDPQYVEQRKEAERHVAKSVRAHYVEQLSGSMLIASIKANKPMAPAECIAKANEMADALGMGVAECDKQ